jgi:hypothetical protein
MSRLPLTQCLPLDLLHPIQRVGSRHSPHLGGQAEFLALSRHSRTVERKNDVVCTLLQVSISNHRPGPSPREPSQFPLPLSSLSNEETTLFTETQSLW